MQQPDMKGNFRTPRRAVVTDREELDLLEPWGLVLLANLMLLKHYVLAAIPG
jgi:hypothetical protein